MGHALESGRVYVRRDSVKPIVDGGNKSFDCDVLLEQRTTEAGEMNNEYE